MIEVKSKFGVDYRRFNLDSIRPLDATKLAYQDLYNFLENLYSLKDIPFIIEYEHPTDKGILPINNDDNCLWALKTCVNMQRTSQRCILRLHLSRRGQSVGETIGYGNKFTSSAQFMKAWETARDESASNDSVSGSAPSSLQDPILRSGKKRTIQISQPDQFRLVSSIIDVDRLPTAYRRVCLVRDGVRPLGFFIRNGTSMRVSENGIERVDGIFISRLIRGGLAEMTGLIAVDDEVIEVNGIEVYGKSLDQVTDMMVANSANLIITIKPVNQNTTLRRMPKALSAAETENDRSSIALSTSFGRPAEAYSMDLSRSYGHRTATSGGSHNDSSFCPDLTLMDDMHNSSNGKINSFAHDEEDTVHM